VRKKSFFFPASLDLDVSFNINNTQKWEDMREKAGQANSVKAYITKNKTAC
jgi:hypothetical protein